MNKRILIAILAVASACVSAGTLTVNGNSCGSWTKLTYSGTGDITILADGQCGITVPPHVEPPVTPPAACPAGVVCVDKTLPFPQQKVSLGASQILSVKMVVNSAGQFRTIDIPASSPNRVVALSVVPGDMNPANTRCKNNGGEVTSNLWQTTPGNRKCVFLPGSTIYANIQMTNCTTSRCTFLIAAQEGL